jgi:hypothetical protein
MFHGATLVAQHIATLVANTPAEAVIVAELVTV